MATYYALTTQNAPLLGWRIVGIGDSRAEVEREAEAAIGSSRDVYTQTDLRNLRVVSKSEAERQYGLRPTATFDPMADYYAEEIDALADRRRQEAAIAREEREGVSLERAEREAADRISHNGQELPW